MYKAVQGHFGCLRLKKSKQYLKNNCSILCLYGGCGNHTVLSDSQNYVTNTCLILSAANLIETEK